MAILEVRKFRINRFNRERRTQWCEEERDRAIERRNVQRASHEYDEEAYQNIVQVIQDSNILDSVGHSTVQAKLLNKRLSKF